MRCDNCGGKDFSILIYKNSYINEEGGGTESEEINYIECIDCKKEFEITDKAVDYIWERI